MRVRIISGWSKYELQKNTNEILMELEQKDKNVIDIKYGGEGVNDYTAMIIFEDRPNV